MSRKTRAPLSEIVAYWNEEGRARLRSFAEQNKISNQSVNTYNLTRETCLCCVLLNREEQRSSRIERAHIISAANGGNGEPHNLVPLCAKCHRDHPQISQERFFFEYLLTGDISLNFEGLNWTLAHQVFKDHEAEIKAKVSKDYPMFKASRNPFHSTKKAYLRLCFELIQHHPTYKAA